jgi:hypothetical protein
VGSHDPLQTESEDTLALLKNRESKQTIDFTECDWRRDPGVQAAEQQCARLRARAHELADDARQRVDVDRLTAILENPDDGLELLALTGDVDIAQLEAARGERDAAVAALAERQQDHARTIQAVALAERRMRDIESAVKARIGPKAQARYAELVKEAEPAFRAAAGHNAGLREFYQLVSGWCHLPVAFPPDVLLCADERSDVYTRHPAGQTQLSFWWRAAKAAKLI